MVNEVALSGYHLGLVELLRDSIFHVVGRT